MKRAIVGILLTACLVGCNSGKRIAKANDALRVERETLKERVTSLESENAELRVKVSELSAERDHTTSPDALAAMPRVSSIELTRSSSIWTKGGASEIRFFIAPKDGLGRFVQAIGTLKLRVVATGKEGEPPTTLAEQDITPTEIRDAYASAIGGPVYLFEVPLAKPPASSVALRAVFTDAITGATHEAERLIEAGSGINVQAATLDDQ